MTWNSGPCRHWPPGSGQLVVNDEYPDGLWIPDSDIEADEQGWLASEQIHNGTVVTPEPDEDTGAER